MFGTRYSGGVGEAGLTFERSSTLRDFPMTFEPLVHMPAPLLETGAGACREPFNATPTGVNSIPNRLALRMYDAPPWGVRAVSLTK